MFNVLGKRSVGGSDMEPGKLWVDLGLLVVESRLPSESDKGWREGPHCPTKTSGNSHLCESNNFLVRKIISIHIYLSGQVMFLTG